MKLLNLNYGNYFQCTNFISFNNFKHLLTLVLFVFLANISIGQIAVNSFESSGDTWTPLTFSTVPCTVGADEWDYDTALSSITPSDGSQFWGIRDLQGSCGGAGYETITHPSLNVSSYTGVTISFDYYTIGYENVDNLGYEIWEDGVKVVDLINLNDNSGGWLTITYNVTASVTNVYLVLKAKQNGADDYAGFDNVEVNGTLSGPSITIIPSSLTGFTYVETFGPSAEQSFTVEGSSLTNDIDVTPSSTDWEISLTSGGPFQTTAITLAESGGTVASTTIYTRMVSGLLIVNSPFSTNISCTSTGATTQNVAVDGTVTAPASPAIVVSPSSLTGFTYVETFGPSGEQTFTVEGTNLTNDIDVTPPTGWEISLTTGGPFQTTPVTLAHSGGTVTNTTIYTQMVSGLLEVNSPFSGNIACTSVGATNQNIAVDGTVTLLGASCSTVFSDDFSAGLSSWSNTGDWTTLSNELKHNLSGVSGSSYIYSNIGNQDLTAIDHEWEVCMRNGNWDPSGSNKFAFFILSNALNLLTTPDGYAVGINQNGSSDLLELYSVNGGVYTSIITSVFNWDANDDVCIRVTRTSAGAWELFYNENGSGEVSGGTTTNTTYTSGQYIGPTFTYTSSRAGLLYIDDVVVCGAPSPTVITSTNSLTGFTYVEGSGPSAEQNFTVEGTNLTNDIDITPPTNWGISLVLGGPYQTTAITLAQSGGTVATTTIYTIMLGGLTQGSSPYSGSISCVSTGATTVNIAVDGTVTSPPSPTIVVAPVSLTGFNYPEGSGPSAEQTFTVEGSNLTNDIDITPPASWEISLTTGGPFQISAITLTQGAGTVSSTTIYTRMVIGLSAGSSPYSGNIACTSTGAATQNVAVDGTVMPLCAIPTAQPTGLNYVTVTSNQIDGTFTASSPVSDEYLVVRSLNVTLSSNPIDGTTYLAGDALGGGVVVQSGSSLSFSDTGLTPLTPYYYYIFSYNNVACSGGPIYMTSSPLTGNTTTLEPPCMDEDFVDFSDWTDGGTAADNTASHYGAAAPCRQFGSGDDMVSPSVDYPNNLEFYQDASGSGNGNDATVEYQIASGGWVLFHTFTVTSSGATESIDLTNLSGVDLSAEFDVTFRFNSTFGSWYLDDVVVECSGCTPTHTITSFTPNSGPVGTEFVITGTGFTAGSTVNINGTLAIIIAQTATEIIAEVSPGSTTGAMSIIEAGCILLSTDFTVDAPSGICYGGTGFNALYISEIYDSESGNLGYIELHNPTGVAVDLDTPGTGYFIRIDSNGDTVIDINIDLTGTIAANSVFVIQLGSGSTCAVGVDFNGPASGINEDDIIYLERNNSYVDRVNAPSEVGYTMERNGNAVGPTTSFDIADWSSNSSESCDGLGNPTIVFPVISILVDQNICIPNFSVNAIPGSGGALTYVWYFNDGSTWAIVNATNLPGLTLSGETTNSLTLTAAGSPISSIDNYQFYVEVTESGTCSNVSNTAMYTDPGGCSICPTVVVDVILNDDFNDGDVSDWFQQASGEWGTYNGTQDTPYANVLNGANSVRQYLDSNSDLESSFGYKYDDCLEGVTSTWRFQMYNNSDPTINNYFLIYLTNSSETTTQTTGTGYAIGVKPSVVGDHDFIELFKVVDGAIVSTIVNTGIAWQSTAHGDPFLPNNKVGIEVTRSETGLWGVKLDVDGGLDNLVSFGVPATNTDFNSTESFVVYRKHTGSTENTIMIDDVYISQTGCDLLYYSQGTGVMTDAIWSDTQVGVGATLMPGKFTRLNIQNGDVITLDVNTTMHDITIEDGSLIASDKDVCITGDFFILPSGSFDEGTSEVSFNGKTAQTILTTSATTFYDMVSDNPAGITTSSDIEIRNGLFPEEGFFNFSAGSITVKSDASGTGGIAEIKSGASISPEVSLERFIPADVGSDAYPGGWVAISTPIEGKTITDWNADLITTGFTGSDYDSYAYPNGDLFVNIIKFVGGTWDYATNVTNAIDDEKGYFIYMGVAGATTHMTGSYKQGDEERTLTNGFHLLVNPYPCAVNWDMVYNLSDFINPVYYVFDSDAGVYKSYNAASQTGSAGNVIAASQAFWVTSDPGVSIIRWEENQKVINGSDAWERTNKQLEGFSIVLNQEEIIDQCFIGFHEDASANFDSEFDITKFAIPFPDNELYTISSISDDNHSLQNNIQYTGIETIDIPVHVFAEFDSEYSISFKGLQFVNDTRCIIIEDLYTGEQFDINDEFEYSFIVNEEIENRFIIHVTSSNLCANVNSEVSIDEENSSYELEVYNTESELIISTPEIYKNSTINIVNSLGQLVMELNDKNIETYNTIDISSLSKGAYFLIIKTNSNTIYSDKFVK